ncbi:MAG: DPP IV N-terminal domain-containing protein [Anaerolineae bacterium]|nr:DPP IV N-terminal domain-containing protein [Anaerolineae bacterium]
MSVNPVFVTLFSMLLLLSGIRGTGSSLSISMLPRMIQETDSTPGNGMIAFSPYYESLYTTYLMDADGANLHRLLETGNSFGAVWSPDGRLIAFIKEEDDNDNVYVMDADGSNPRRLTDGPSISLSLAWSPDSQQIAFVSYRDRNPQFNYDIYVVDVDTAELHRLTQEPVLEQYPEWSPDGRFITFTQQGSHYGEDIYIMNADGSDRHLLVDDAWGLSPVWSHDGLHIAFYNTLGRNSGIYVMDADGSNVRHLVTNLAVDPAWSPDDRTLAYVSNGGIWVMDADGSNRLRLTDRSTFDYAPMWSPDGRYIAFVSLEEEGDNIYVMDADGSNRRRLTPDIEAAAGLTGYMSWQPVMSRP